LPAHASHDGDGVHSFRGFGGFGGRGSTGDGSALPESSHGNCTASGAGRLKPPPPPPPPSPPLLLAASDDLPAARATRPDVST